MTDEKLSCKDIAKGVLAGLLLPITLPLALIVVVPLTLYVAHIWPLRDTNIWGDHPDDC